MALFETEHISSVANKLLADLKKYLCIFTIITHVFFLGLYTYEVIKTRSTLFLFICYIVILVIAVISFISYLICLRKKVKSKTWNTVLKISKYVACLATIVFNYVIYFVNTHDKLQLLFTSISLILLILQIVLMLVTNFIEKYINEFVIAFRADYDESNFIGKKIIKKTFLSRLIEKDSGDNENM